MATDFAMWFSREFGMTCLGVDSGAELAAVRAKRSALHAACSIGKTDAGWTHENCDGDRFRMTPEQAAEEKQLFCCEFLISGCDADELVCAPEKPTQRQQRVDEAVTAFLASAHVVREEGARVSHADFAAALRREMKLKNVSQHAISQGCKRAGLLGLASHAARYWLGLKLV